MILIGNKKINLAIGNTPPKEVRVGDRIVYSAKKLVAKTKTINIQRPHEAQGNWSTSVTITTNPVVDVSISGILKGLSTSDDGRCDVTLYVNDEQIGKTGTWETQVSKSFDSLTELKIKLVVSPHSSDSGIGFFTGTVTYKEWV